MGHKKNVNKKILKILDIIAKNKLVLNVGHLSGPESINLVTLAKNHGVKKILIPANHLSINFINQLNLIPDIFFEFSYFFISKATKVPLTHIDGEKHVIDGLEKKELSNLIKKVSSKKVILSSDCGVSILPKPTVGLKSFIREVLTLGFTHNDIDNMTINNPKKLFFA
jgi:hypothetical protein